jgi:hypothetical protein
MIQNLLLGMCRPQSFPACYHIQTLTLVSAGFGAIITAAAAWSIFGTGNFGEEGADPTGDPENWSVEEMRRWLKAVWLLGNSPEAR